MNNDEKWSNPLNKYKINDIVHTFIEKKQVLIDNIKAFGFGGVVTNVPFTNGFVENDDNFLKFNDTLKLLNDNQLEYWIYDEFGYPSGQANGLVVNNHKELIAQCLYMRKFECIDEKLKFVYKIDGISNYIAFACKYKLDLSIMSETTLLFDTFEEINHSKKSVEIDLKSGEVCYIYIVKDAYEGTHSVHNVSSRRKYINILNRKAVKRFIEIALKPIALNCPSAFSNSSGVFTDEPSLMVAYCRDYEDNNYATIPYDKKILDGFEKRFGYNLKKYLVYLFENRDNKYQIHRVNFYSYIAELISNNYTKQINDFLKKHGSFISGHYLAEEHLVEHVMNYGNFVDVLCQSGYPGMDILKCIPNSFYFNAPKYLQMITRKTNSNGFMVEYCPFFNIEEFNSNPIENTYGSLSILLLNGARKFHTYFSPNFAKYDARLSMYNGTILKEEYQQFNLYVSRISSLLENEKQLFDTFVYYAIEDVQSKYKPRTCGNYFDDSFLLKADNSINIIADSLLLNGKEYGFLDKNDLNDKLSCTRIIVPETDFMLKETALHLKKMHKKGVTILFHNKVPSIIDDDNFVIDFGIITNIEQMQKKIPISTKMLRGNFKNIMTQHYSNEYLFVYNNNLSNKILIANQDLKVYNPIDGRITYLKKNDDLLLTSYRCLIIQKG